MGLEINVVEQAYLYLKNYIYSENLNLFLKQGVAEFETKGDLEDRFNEIVACVNADNLNAHSQFQTWLEQIKFHILPKHVKSNEKEHGAQEKGLFISNVREEKSYSVSKINYFINAPVELHIIDTLWCLYVGPVLEAAICKHNYGNRMSASALQFTTSSDSHHGSVLFKYFIKQYNRWRDQAIQIATDISEKKDNVALLSLDLTSYFYNINLDFEEIIDAIRLYYTDNNELLLLARKLNLIIQEIHTVYNEKISDFLKITHPDCSSKNGLPIGLASSAIIANWYLSDFDTAISETVNPIYYGRYVDDILIVIKNASINKNNNDNNDPIENFIGNYLAGILFEEKNKEDKKQESNDYYIETKNNRLFIQKSKLILQFYDKSHSRAGLEIFKKELDERSSAFKFLPSEHINKELEQFAYDVLYEGSANKLRSIVGIAENETELAKYLASHITAHRLCKIDNRNKVLNQIKLFFKGRNALQFFRLWEKIYQYAIIIKSESFVNKFYQYINDEISKIEFISDVSVNAEGIKNSIQQKIHKDLQLYSQLSFEISLGLINIENFKYNWNPENLDFARQFRQANLIRHHLVAWPLLNYTNCEGDLTDEKCYLDMNDIELDAEKIKYSPRFIHFDELQLFNLKDYVGKKQLHIWMNETIKLYEEKNFAGNFLSQTVEFKEENEGKNISKCSLKIKENYNKNNTLALAIANLKVSETDINSAIRKDQRPNLSFQRQEELYFMLNSAIKEKADIFVLPEVSIPVSWLPFMVTFARRHQIGLIFGLEHWVINDCAYNLLIEALPFKNSDKYKSCVVTARIKNHYAPAELELIDTLRLKAGNMRFDSDAFYHKVSWRGVSFATYNCFELSDITHRVLFKSEIDLLIACVWNKDTNYYQHILESAVRDLHCYTVQANTSQYGGSCVLRPAKTESKTLLYVKGGDNACILTTHLDIKKLREFQYKSKPSAKDEFKHLPPGYDCEAVLDR
ncbi:RNA-directed DNA polymerase [Snodgrassella gandavensis]|uniref:RNA-directed DNA polymerase n=1 Tax=Snodgrassella gandavensis TaxID=2946698 RepID=UPI001EF6ABB1|nr:reverse transcriptase domain-containing protein [Snodgrassella gandavensis]